MHVAGFQWLVAGVPRSVGSWRVQRANPPVDQENTLAGMQQTSEHLLARLPFRGAIGNFDNTDAESDGCPPYGPSAGRPAGLSGTSVTATGGPGVTSLGVALQA